MEAWDLARWNFGNRFPQKIGCFGPATAKRQGDGVFRDARLSADFRSGHHDFFLVKSSCLQQDSWPFEGASQFWLY